MKQYEIRADYDRDTIIGSIQVGISRHLIQQYNEDWIVDIQNYTALANKIYNLRLNGQYDKAKELLPKEKVYPVSEKIMKRLEMD